MISIAIRSKWQDPKIADSYDDSFTQMFTSTHTHTHNYLIHTTDSYHDSFTQTLISTHTQLSDSYDNSFTQTLLSTHRYTYVKFTKQFMNIGQHIKKHGWKYTSRKILDNGVMRTNDQNPETYWHL